MLTDGWPVTAALDPQTGNPDVHYTSDEHASILAGLIARDVNGAPRAGVLPRHTNNLVTARPDMKVDVAPFEAVLVNEGVRMIALTEQLTLDVAAAQAANTRYDIVYVEVTDRALTGVKSTSAVKIATGQAASIPQDPAVPAGAVRLARLTITANATATNSGVTITAIHQFTCTTGGTLVFRTTTEMNAWSAGPGQRAYVIASSVEYVRVGTSWEVAYGPSGVDAAGWTWITMANGKRRFYRYFGDWSAPQSFGVAGGSFWTQTRQSNIAPPTGLAWDGFLIRALCWGKNTAFNGLQQVLQCNLSIATGTTAASLNVFNPTGIVVANTSMELRSSIELIEL